MSTPSFALPPGPASRFPGQNLLAFRRDPILFLRHVAQTCGDVSSFRLGPQRLTLLNHPDLIRDVLVTHAGRFHKGRGLERAKRLLGDGLLTSEGDFHRRQRRLIQPAFHRPRLVAYSQAVAAYGQQAGQRWRDGQSVDMAAEMMRLTLAIIGKTLFDTELEEDAVRIGDAITEALRLFHLLMLPYADLLERLPLPPVRRFNAARDRLDAIIFRLIRERREGGKDRGDLLSLLLRSGEEGTAEMTDAQIRDEALTLFLAGHETTANALTWTWYVLSQNHEAESKFHAELDTVLEGRPPTYDDLPRLTYTRQVLAEAMRLFPPAWIVGRRATEDYAVGGYVVPRGDVVLLCQAVTHHDGRWFPEPERFDPSRWAPGADADRPKFAYFPFGGGPRTCLGEQFAWMEGVLLLATLGARWRMRLAPGQRVAWQPIITLRPRHGMRMRLERRGA